MKRLIQRSLNVLGFEIRRKGRPRFDQDVTDFILNRDIGLVLDVGANVGQFGGSLRAKGYKGKIVSFEPVPQVYETLAAEAASDPDWEVKNFALGAKSDFMPINVAASSVFSSILPSTGAATRFDTAAAVTRTEVIETRTLDDVCGNVSGNILLKIDTQGYEKQVLEGGRQTLARIKGILMELPIIHLYEGTWHFHEAVEFMAKADFIPAQIHPVNYHPVDDVSLVEVDCLFRRRERYLDS